MKREEMTELIKTRKDESLDNDITLSERHDVYLGEEYGSGRLSIEYKPEEYRLDQQGLDQLAGKGFFEDAGAPEEIVSDLYWALVDLLYPNSSYLDEPWGHLPLVVELESRTESEVSDFYCSLGTYR